MDPIIPSEEDAVALGTTIMACAFQGGVILGADSRTSTGDFVANRASDKITRLAERVYICRSGSAADTQNLSSYVQYFISQHEAERNRPVDVRTAAQLAVQVAYPNKDRLSAGLIVAGWDATLGGQVYGVPMGGSLLPLPFTIGGSGSTYILGYCDRNYRENMNEAACREFVLRSVSLAMARDGSSGGCVRLVIITEDGVKREFVPGSSVPLHYGEGGVKGFRGVGVVGGEGGGVAWGM